MADDKWAKESDSGITGTGWRFVFEMYRPLIAQLLLLFTSLVQIWREVGRDEKG